MSNFLLIFCYVRGEFQYKEVKISAAELIENIGHLLPESQLIYIATDEKNKTFFNDFQPRFPNIRYLDDYYQHANLSNINPNFLGMIDQVVCAKGQYFVGTWFSTFTGYITRMRGYLGFHDYTVYYGDKKRRYVTELVLLLLKIILVFKFVGIDFITSSYLNFHSI